MLTYIKLDSHSASLFRDRYPLVGIGSTELLRKTPGIPAWSDQLAGCDHFLSAFYPRHFGLCGGTGGERRLLSHDPGASCIIWSDHLRYLRSHQPGYHQ